MKRKFINHNFRKASLDQIATINSIIADYQADGYRLSLRQLYYQLVARDLIANSVRSYKKIGVLVSNGRKAGLIDWSAIEDRARETMAVTTWENPAEIVNTAAEQFEINKWETQPNHIHVMVEKDALSGVLWPVCEELGIKFTANKGYPSDSLLYEMARGLVQQKNAGKQIRIIHLGDHDPSGIDMTRDLVERLALFAGFKIKVQRIALNYPQIEELKPPENPAKQTDTRFKDYAAKFGYASWELDAIEPRRLAELVRGIVESLRDDTLWDKAVKKEQKMKKELLDFAKSYGKES